MLKLAATQQQHDAAQQARSFNAKVCVTLTCTAGACDGRCMRDSRW